MNILRARKKLNFRPMKRSKCIFISVLLFVSTSVFTQPQRPVREKVETMKVGFITERLNLTVEEAKTFWPVYNQYQDELETLRKPRRENLMNAKKNFDEMSDKDIEKAVDSEIAFRQSELDLLKKYHPQFKKVLPIKKVAKLYRAEEDFKGKIVDMIHEKRENKRGFQK